MSSIASKLALRDQPIPAERAPALPEGLPDAPQRARRLGRVRLPLGGPYRPTATAYRLPDGRVVWCVRLWEVDHAVRHVVSSETVRRFCRLNRLVSVEEEVDGVEAR